MMEGMDVSDDRNDRSPVDLSRINLNDDHQMRYWSKALGVTEEELKRAIKGVGPLTRAVRAFLNK